ncbi:MAG: sugar phosphate isomerase/epimerase family protein [Oscillospiraceae bacterium]
MNKVLCSTGALIGQPNGRNHKLLWDCSKVLKCDGYEFMFYSTWYDKIEQIVKDIKSMNLYIPIYHCEKHIGESISRCQNLDFSEPLKLFELNCQIASEFKSKKMVMHLWDGITSDQNFSKNLVAYKLLNDIANKYNIMVMVENVVCNKENPLKHFLELENKYPDIKFTYDTKMSAFHNQIDAVYSKEWSWLWNNHIEHLHINDFNGSYLNWNNLRSLHIGDGWIDFDKFFKFIQSVGYNQDFTIEATSFDRENGHIDCNRLNETILKVREYIY